MCPRERNDQNNSKEHQNEIGIDPLTWLLSAPLGAVKRACGQEKNNLDKDKHNYCGEYCCHGQYCGSTYCKGDHHSPENIINNQHYFTHFNGLECSKATISGEKASHTLAHFMACFIYSYWHGVPFSKIASHRKKSLISFTNFVRDILKVTTLQLSVVLLSLKLVLHLKSLRPNLNGAEGSEFRLLVCTLMLAMKLLVDNTYTNFTWQKVSRIPLDQINTVEMEFLTQVNYRLYFSQEDFRSWLCFVRNSLIDFVLCEISLGDNGCQECRKHEIFTNDLITSELSITGSSGFTARNKLKNSQFSFNNSPKGYSRPSTVSSILPKHYYKHLSRDSSSPMLMFPTPSSPSSYRSDDLPTTSKPQLSCSDGLRRTRRSSNSTSCINLITPDVIYPHNQDYCTHPLQNN